MLIFSRPAAGLVLVAVAAGLYGYDRLWPISPPRSVNAPTEASKPPPPVAVLATAAPTPPAEVEAPAHMTSAQQASFETWMIKTYLGCWKPAPQAADADLYVAQVRLAFNPDGSLAKPAKLVNPPSDPALKPQAKSVMAAVQSCNPLPVPAQYRPFYEQWKTKTIHFNPQVAGR
jgi:colicin import membrane protein